MHCDLHLLLQALDAWIRPQVQFLLGLAHSAHAFALYVHRVRTEYYSQTVARCDLSVLNGMFTL